MPQFSTPEGMGPLRSRRTRSIRADVGWTRSPAYCGTLDLFLAAGFRVVREHTGAVSGGCPRVMVRRECAPAGHAVT
jgi:hypothetical protein